MYPLVHPLTELQLEPEAERAVRSGSHHGHGRFDRRAQQSANGSEQ
jgi:hypothetical protein